MLHLSIYSLALLAVAQFSIAAPVTRLQIRTVPGAKEGGSYIVSFTNPHSHSITNTMNFQVKLKDGANKQLAIAWLQNHLGKDSLVTYDYDATVSYMQV